MTDPRPNRIETVEGKTFEEWLAEVEQYASPRQARELVALKFGQWPGPQPLAEDGTPIPQQPEEEDTV